MCGRYALTHPSAVLTEVLDELEAPASPLGVSEELLLPRFNVAPSQEMPVVLPGESVPAEAAGARWGWERRRGGGLTINARAETLAEKALFSRALRERRCLVPASGFYEWQRRGGAKQPYFVRLASSDRSGAAPPMAFAGLWRHQGGSRHYTIVTQPAVVEIAEIHDRMPVMLAAADRAPWLDPGLADPQALTALLLQSRPELRFHPVSTRVNSAAEEGPELIRESAPLPRNLELF